MGKTENMNIGNYDNFSILLHACCHHTVFDEIADITIFSLKIIRNCVNDSRKGAV